MSRSKLNWDNLVGADGNYLPGGGGGGGGSVLNYKGSVATAADLSSVSDPQESDTYYVSSEGVYYAYNGTTWDNVGSPNRGETGEKGVPGADGDKGIQGPQGNVGPKGAPGAASSKGEPGTDGTKGEPGTDGTDGAKGETGVGEKGVPGDKGEIGLTGQKGEIGVGEKGEQGVIGPKGEVGTKGEEGEKGIEGQKGDEKKGEKGTAAALLNFLGSVDSITDLPAQPQPAGDTYLVLDAETNYTSDGAAWQVSGSVTKGQKGQKGYKGEKGQKGKKGTKGADVKGEKGQQVKGQKGAPAPLLLYLGNVDTVGDLPLTPVPDAGDTYYIDDGTSLYYSWDGTAWVNAGQAIKGEKGQKGQKGLKGQKGQKGYKGEKGEKGLKGEKGEKGEKGRKGLKGVKAEKGRVGSKGTMPAGAVVAHITFNGETATTAGNFLADSDIYSEFGIAASGGQVERVAEGRYKVYFANPFQLPYTQAELDAGVDSEGNTIPAPPAGTTLDLDNPIYYHDANNSYTALASCGLGSFTASGVSANIVTLNSAYCEIVVERADSGDDKNVDFVSVAFYGSGTGGSVIEKGQKGEPNGPKGKKGFKGKKGTVGPVAAGAASAHVSFNASNAGAFAWPADEIASFNVSDVTRVAEGIFTVTWAKPFLTDAYTIVGSAGAGNHTSSNRTVSIDAQNAASCQFRVESDGGGQFDEEYIAIIAYGDGASGIHSEFKGEQGEKGPQGPSTLAVGTTTTVAHNLPAAVTNSGSLNSAVFDFEIPKGEKGQKQYIAAGAVTAHVNFVASSSVANGVLAASNIKSSFGITQVEKIRKGEFEITFENPFEAPDPNNPAVLIPTDNSYTATGTAFGDYGATFGGTTRVVLFMDPLATKVTVNIEENNGSRGDADQVSCVFYGTGAVGQIVEAKGDKGDIGPSGGPVGPEGPKGTLGTINIGTTTSVESANAAVTNSGTPEDAILDFDLPKGQKGTSGAAVDKGEIGPAGTIAVGTVRSVPQSLVAINNTGTPENAVLDFDVPKGSKGEQGLPGTATAKGEVGSKGEPGTAGTIAAGTVTPVTLGNERVVNSGTAEAAVFDFDIPVVPGDKGEPGRNGNALFLNSYAAFTGDYDPATQTWSWSGAQGYGGYNIDDVEETLSATQSEQTFKVLWDDNYSDANYAVFFEFYDGLTNADQIGAENRLYRAIITDKTASYVEFRIVQSLSSITGDAFSKPFMHHISVHAMGSD